MAARVLALQSSAASRHGRGLKTARVEMAERIDPAWSSADDHALVRACLAGRREAFDVLVERHRRQVYQLCYRFAGNHEDASDLAQEAFIRAYRALGGFKGQSAVGTWLHRIAVNLCLNRVTARPLPVEPLGRREHLDQREVPADVALLRA